MGDTIRKSLRLLCDKHSDWSRHLQTVAMAYRCAATSNLLLSPYEVIFGRRMITPIEWNLMLEEPTVASPEAYARDIRPRLEILHQIAVENARDSAIRHALAKNQGASPPTFKEADKVLLSNSVT